MIGAPADESYSRLDTVLAECDRHRWLLAAFFVVAMGVGAIASTGGYVEYFGIGAALISGTGAGSGFVSRWRGWLED